MRQRARLNAFSLIEVTITTALLGILLLMSWLLVPQSIQATKQSLLSDYAGLLAAEELSRFRSIPSQDVSAGTLRNEVVRGPEDCDFRVVCEVSSVSGFNLAELRRAQVTVSWKYRQRPYYIREQAESCGIVF